MSSRAFKKLQKKQQQLEEQQEQLQEEEEEEQEVQQVVKNTNNFFMMDDSEEEEEEEEEQNDEEEEERKRQEEEEEEERKRKEQEEQQGKGKKKKNKKKNKNNKKEEEDQELKEMLEELKLENEKKQKEEEEERKKQVLNEEDQEEFKQDELQYQQGNLILNSPLQIIVGKLNYDKELQKYFKNAKFIEETQANDDEQFAGIKDKRLLKRLKNQRQPKHQKQLKLVYGLKNVRPVPERFQCKEIDTNQYGQKVFALFPTKQYEKLQGTYEGLKNTMDPQNIFDFIQKNPYHVDGLFDISEFYRLQGQFKQANQLLTQILYVYEDSFGPTFSQIFDDFENKICLSIDHTPFSKALFMSLLKFSDILGKKGCFRAALEYNKFLLKLDPYNDPLGALLCLDYFALSSKQYSYLQYFVKTFGKSLYRNSKFSILYMPNMIYSYSIAQFLDTKDHLFLDMQELLTFTKEHFDQAINFKQDAINLDKNVLILQAILLYPKLISELGQKNEFHKQQISHSILQKSQKKSFRELFEQPFFLENSGNTPFYGFLGLSNDEDIEGLNKINEIYIERSKIVYKNNQILLWLKAAIGFLLDEMEERQFDYQEFIAELCEIRDYNIIPFQFSRYKQTTKANFSDHVDRLDLNNIEEEEQAQIQQQMEQMQQQQGQLNPLDQNAGFFQSLFSSMLPWVNLPEQNQNNNNQNVVYQDDDVQIQDENDDFDDQEDED